MEAVSSIPPHETGGVDDLLRASIPDIPIEVNPQVSMSAMTEPHAFMPVKMPPPLVAPPPLPPVAAPPALTPSDPAPVVFQSVSERTSENVKSAEEAHAGMLDPWANQPEEELPQHAEPQLVSPESLGRLERRLRRRSRDERAPRASAGGSSGDQSRAEKNRAAAASSASASISAGANARVCGRRGGRARARRRRGRAYHARARRWRDGRNACGVARAKRVDLSAVDALSDLPDDARGELESIAEVHNLARDEEVMGFAFAFVVSGAVDVAAQIVDAAAERLAEGAVLKAKGTVAESVPLRLICASENAVVATWTAEQIEPAFKTCPWVEDDLRASANRMQALVGVTLGPLADRLDAALRAQVTSRLELRELAEGDVIVEAGQPVRELCLVGQGSIEVVKDGKVISEVPVGDFLFPAEIMGGGKAQGTARAGKGGALVLAGARSVAQELMMTCPPLLEIFAGM